MKLGSWGNLAENRQTTARSAAAFTFTNLLVSLGIFLLVIGGIISSHLFGLKLMRFSQNKLGAFESSPKNLQIIVDDIRAAKKWRVGEGDTNGFTEVAMNTPQVGGALQIWPTDDTNAVVRYFIDSSASQLKRLGTNGLVSILFTSISNTPPFRFEDFRGNTLTNVTRFAALRVSLGFQALAKTGLPIGPGQYYTSYVVNTRITRRSLE